MKAEKNKGAGRAKGKKWFMIFFFWQKIYFICKWAFVKAVKCFYELYSSLGMWKRDLPDSVDQGSNLVFKDKKTWIFNLQKSDLMARLLQFLLPQDFFLKTKQWGFSKLHRVLWYRKTIFKTSLTRGINLYFQSIPLLSLALCSPQWTVRSYTLQVLFFWFCSLLLFFLLSLVVVFIIPNQKSLCFLWRLAFYSDLIKQIAIGL